jgi:hypothetical protein
VLTVLVLPAAAVALQRPVPEPLAADTGDHGGGGRDSTPPDRDPRADHPT